MIASHLKPHINEVGDLSGWWIIVYTGGDGKVKVAHGMKHVVSEAAAALGSHIKIVSVHFAWDLL